MLIPKKYWDTFTQLQNSSHGDYMTASIIWKRSKHYLAQFNEDYDDVSTPQPPSTPTDDGYDYIPLSVLINFNYERTWPIANDSESGDLDRQSCQIYFSIEQLAEAGYLDVNGNLAYDQGADRFIINGSVFRYDGDTPAAQIPQGKLVFTIVVRPDAKATGQKIIPVPPVPAIPTPPVIPRYALRGVTLSIKDNPIPFNPDDPSTYILLTDSTKIAREYQAGQNILNAPYFSGRYVAVETIVLDSQDATYLTYFNGVFTNPFGNFNNNSNLGFLYESLIP